MRIREPKTTALVFASGKVVVTGAKSEDDSRLASRKYARIIQKLGFEAKFQDFKIQNMVGSVRPRLRHLGTRVYSYSRTVRCQVPHSLGGFGVQSRSAFLSLACRLEPALTLLPLLQHFSSYEPEVSRVEGDRCATPY